LGVLALALLPAWERRCPAPLLPVRLLRTRTLAVACGAGASLGASLFGALLLVPLYAEVAKSGNAAAAGPLLLPLTAAVVLGSTVDRRRGGPRRPRSGPRQPAGALGDGPRAWDVRDAAARPGNGGGAAGGGGDRVRCRVARRIDGWCPRRPRRFRGRAGAP